MRFAGSAARAHDAGRTPLLHSGRASRVNPLGARVQSCICWSSEAGAAGHAPEPLRKKMSLFVSGVSGEKKARLY